MKCTGYLYGAVLVCLLCVVVVPSWADPMTCRKNEVGVTIIKENGTVKELCVGAPELDHIGEKSDEVIPAVCPSFALEDVNGLPVADPDEGYEVYCYEGDDYVTRLSYKKGTCRGAYNGIIQVDDLIRGRHIMAYYMAHYYEETCILYGKGHIWSDDLHYFYWSATEAEAMACAAVIRGSKWWDMCSR